MLNIGDIRELIRLMDETSIHELEIESEGSRLRLKKADPVAPVWVTPGAPAGEGPSYGPAAAAAAAPASATAANAAPSAPAESPAAPPPAEDSAQIHIVRSPMVGTFYRAPAPDAPPFVDIGSKVGEKTVVCIVEAMKLMNEIEAECSGEIVEVLAENGQLVEYGQPLFKIKRS
ncbi:MAG: acetyl-CoA carboxylase biotin carboxyl carrier protein [Alicyclobacillus sp.]|nr:acetyl-CoA carboxylase biotin carboxyl carrier protein [Alicyclobacillus sp.]